MSRDEIVNVILKNIRENLEDLEGQDIDSSKSMVDLGANSLDIVEIVSCSMRELKIKVPRSELSNLKNIDELVDLFLRVHDEQAATT